MYRSNLITLECKQEHLNKLKAIESSDKFCITEKYCEGAHPDLKSKQGVWDLLMSEAGEKLPLYELDALCDGFKQGSQRDLFKNFAAKFFENIDGIVQKNDPSRSWIYFVCLKPNLEASAEELKNFEDFLKKIENKSQKGDGDERLKKWCKNSIAEIKEKSEARKLSKEWYDTQ